MPRLTDLIPGWPALARQGYELKRVDNEVIIRYPYYQTLADEYGPLVTRVIRRYPVTEFRQAPGVALSDIEAFESQRHSQPPHSF